MNIFLLHPSLSPEDCAAYHCDQHIHKMILESAQLLSSSLHIRASLGHINLPSEISSAIYKLAYPKHPCTLWTTQSPNNAIWLAELALALQEQREITANCSLHSSIPIIRLIKEFLHELNPYSCSSLHHPHVFCGPAIIAHRNNMTTVERYQEFYHKKARQWPLDTGTYMTYKGRPIPAFMQSILSPQ